jgi:hypothetical protein
LSADLERRARWLNNLPFEPDRALPLPKRVLQSPWTWVTVTATLVFVLLGLDQYLALTANTAAVDNLAPSINFSAVKTSFFYALPTLGFWVAVFLLVDRFRPARPLLWYLTLGWGIAVSTWISVYANTWASMHLGVSQTGGDPAAAMRTAVFIAPFVEEAAKATVLFWLAILLRHRLVSKLSLVALGGLSAAGFAFTENIMYYARAIVYSSGSISVGDADAAISQLVMMRGVWTCFGHPLFTCMTGVGIAVAVRSRSKLVRVLAPLVGYGIAVLMHMVFNSQASTQGEEQLYLLYFLVVLPTLVGLVIALFRQEFTQGRLIRARLTDYVRMGWLDEADPAAFSRLRTRLRALLLGAVRGWRPLVATVRLQRTMTELAYLRDAEARGLVDSAADIRAKELIALAQELRGAAIADPTGMRFGVPNVFRIVRDRLRRRTPPPYQPMPATWAAPPPSSTDYGYSAVNPSWEPPPQ